MSDDWQVVEEAVKFTNYSTSEAVKDKRDVALASLARLREREAEYRDEITAKNQTVAELVREKAVYAEDVWAVDRKREAAEARVARLEEEKASLESRLRALGYNVYEILAHDAAMREKKEV